MDADVTEMCSSSRFRRRFFSAGRLETRAEKNRMLSQASVVVILNVYSYCHTTKNLFLCVINSIIPVKKNVQKLI